MLAVRFRGGLGNQMFQIASVYALAKDNGDDCGFAFNTLCSGQGNSALAYRDNVYKQLKDLPKDWKRKFYYKEPDTDYHPIPYHPDMLLEGYLGHEKYFAHRKDEIIDLFTDEVAINYLKKRYAKPLENSVSLHIRRGDYLKHPNVYVIPTVAYYSEALALLEKQVKIDNIIVVSDDIDWCVDNFRDRRLTFMCGNPDYYDVYMMSLCNHNILANSSFSWWGTYLNRHKDKIVYSPKEWFMPDSGAHTEYLICDNWILI